MAATQHLMPHNISSSQPGYASQQRQPLTTRVEPYLCHTYLCPRPSRSDLLPTRERAPRLGQNTLSHLAQNTPIILGRWDRRCPPTRQCASPAVWPRAARQRPCSDRAVTVRRVLVGPLSTRRRSGSSSSRSRSHRSIVSVSNDRSRSSICVESISSSEYHYYASDTYSYSYS